MPEKFCGILSSASTTALESCAGARLALLHAQGHPLHGHVDELTAAAGVLAMAVDADGTEEVQVEVNLGAPAAYVFST